MLTKRLDHLKKMKMPEKPSAMKDAEIDLELLDHGEDEPSADDVDDMETPPATERYDEMEREENAEMVELANVSDDMLIDEMKKRKLKL